MQMIADECADKERDDSQLARNLLRLWADTQTPLSENANEVRNAFEFGTGCGRGEHLSSIKFPHQMCRQSDKTWRKHRD